MFLSTFNDANTKTNRFQNLFTLHNSTSTFVKEVLLNCIRYSVHKVSNISHKVKKKPNTSQL